MLENDFQLKTTETLGKIEATLDGILTHLATINGRVSAHTKELTERAEKEAEDKLESAAEVARLKLEGLAALNAHILGCPLKSFVSETAKVVSDERQLRAVNINKLEGVVVAVKWLFSVTAILSLLQAASIIKYFKVGF